MANEDACFLALWTEKKRERKRWEKEEDEEEITWTRRVVGDFELEQLGFEQDPWNSKGLILKPFQSYLAA